MDDEEGELNALEHIISDHSAEPINLSYSLMKLITYNFSNEIGRGGFGVVYKGILRNGDVAVKKLYNPHALPDKQFLDEIMCLKKAKHKNIVRFLGYCSETHGELLQFNGSHVMAEVHEKLLCFEYVPNGDIERYLQQEKPCGDDWPARYQMIRGVCDGLHYLHEKHINHLDMKPENVMLDAHMEPKIVDFGLSRCIDQGHSKIITQHILGTPRYIAPEIIDKGELSFKSDIYALGIIIIELLTGINKISLDNWDESLDVDCSRVRRCTEIARNCTDPDKHKRPTVLEIIRDLDELELENSAELTNDPGPFIDQVIATAFSGAELVSVYPLELRFPFVPNQEMHCHLNLTNNTDGAVFAIIPEIPDRYRGELKGFLPPKVTASITLSREAEEELPSCTDKLEILVLVIGSDIDVYKQQMSTLSLEEDMSVEDTFKAAHELFGFELHRAMLTAVAAISKDDDRPLVTNTTGKEEENIAIYCIDVHPTEPWVLVVGLQNPVYIWNWQTNERIGVYERPVDPDEGDEYWLVKFIARKQWVVMGSSNGSILVLTCPTMHLIDEFKAHRDSITSLEVHPTSSLLLTCSYPLSLKIWDWSRRNWSLGGKKYNTTSPVTQVMFNPKYVNTFGTLDDYGIVKMWRTGNLDPIATTQALGHHWTSDLFTYIGDRHFIATINDQIAWIVDLENEEHVHTLYTTEKIVAVVCHPTRPLLVIASDNGSIRVWDSSTRRFKKAYVNLPKNPLHIGFAGPKRIVIGHEKGIAVMDIDLE